MTIQTADTSALADRVQERAQNGPTVGMTLREYVIAQTEEIGTGLPPGTLTKERFVRTVLTEIRKTPTLGDCTRPSFLGAMMQSAQLGLEIGSALGQAYLIPYRDNRRDVTECTFQIGYKGWLAIAARGGILMESREVRENDDFDFRFGTSPMLEHAWNPRRDRGPVAFYYGTASMPDGRMRFHVMSLEEIERRRERSGAVRAGKGSPWNTDYDAMCRKTVIRAMVPQLPMSAEMNDALSTDEGVVTRNDRGDMRVSFPDAIPADVPPVLDEAPQAPETVPEGGSAPDGPPPPSEPPEGQGDTAAAIPQALIDSTLKAIEAWPEDFVVQKLREFEIPYQAKAGVKTLRMTLLQAFLPMRMVGNEAVEALF